MQVKTVSVTYERKQNLGDYSSATVACTIWADVEPADDLDQSMHELWSMAKENVKTQLLPLTKGASINVEEAFLGLPISKEKNK